MSTFPKFFKVQNAQIPTVGLGTLDMTSNICEVVYNSIKDGVRLIDTAANYGSEEGVGKGIKKAIDEGIVKREDLFITTKLDIHERVDSEQAIKNSLKKLGLTYLDLYLDHWPKFFECEKGTNKKTNMLPLHKLWAIMESFVEKGYTKYIGVSNYSVQTLLNLLSFCKIKPLVNEVEYHPYLNQKKLNEFCRSEDIILFGYNPLVLGSYCAETVPDKKNRDLLNEKIITDLAKKYNKTSGQIVLNWFLAKEIIPIPMTSNPHRMKENLGAADFKLSKEEIEAIDGLNRNQRFGRSDVWDIYNKEIDVFA